MKKIVAAFAVALVGIGSAYAGRKTTNPVTINYTYRSASGQFGSVRASADTIQELYCWRDKWSNSGVRGGCHARDAANNYVACQTTDVEMIESMNALTSTARLIFQWNDLGECTRIYVSASSSYAPIAP